MPELPDVETFRRYFNDKALLKEIANVEVGDPGMLVNVSPQKLADSLVGQAFVSSERYGKYLMARLDNDSWLVLHFGMTGYLQYFETLDEDSKYDKLRIEFIEDDCLVFDCRRKLGRITLVEDYDAFIKEKALGPDPMAQEFTISDFMEALDNKKGSIKSALMDQKVLAGIGNVYSDEILFQARLDPSNQVNDLDQTDLENIYNAMIDLLDTAISKHADPENFPASYLIPQRKKDGKCPRCGSDLVKQQVAGRSSYICPGCQKKK